MIKKLRRKFVLVNMGIVVVMLLLVFALVLQSTRQELEDASIRTMNSLMESGPKSGRPGQSGIQLPFIYVSISPVGEVVAARGGYFDLSDQESLEQIIALARHSGAEMGLLREYRLRYLRRVTPFGESLVFVDMSSEMAAVQSLLKSCLVIGLLSLCAFWGLSVLLARWAIAPVEKAWIQQRQFVADASHELKTPLAVILTNAELLAEGQGSAQDNQRFAGSILAMSRQMRGLVESLLELARVDNGTAKMEFSRLSISDLVNDAVLPFEPVYFERGLELRCQIQETLFVRGSGRHLKQVVDILLDNGAKYSDPGGTVWVRLQRQGNHGLLAVSSPGQEIRKEELEKIFQRFYRLDPARAMDQSYGLGLAIARSIVNEHGGKIWAQSQDGWNTFFVSLDLAEK